MSEKIALDAIKGLIQLKPRMKKLHVTFFGGEPTLNPTVIKGVVSYLKSLDMLSRFHITTSGILPNDVLEFLVSERFDFTVSLDGIPRVNDENRTFPSGRPSTSFSVRTLQKLVRNGLSVNVRITVTEENVNAIAETLEYLSSLGVRFVHIELVNELGRAKRFRIIPPEQEVYLRFFRQAIEKAQEVGIFIMNSALMNLLTPSTFFCMSVKGEMFVIGPSGQISLCYQVMDRTADYGEFIVGKVTPQGLEIDDQKLRFMKSIDVGQMDNCTYCFAKNICGGGCPKRNKEMTGDFFRGIPSLCEVRKVIIHESLMHLYRSSQQGISGSVLGTEIYENSILERA